MVVYQTFNEKRVRGSLARSEVRCRYKLSSRADFLISRACYYSVILRQLSQTKTKPRFEDYRAGMNKDHKNLGIRTQGRHHERVSESSTCKQVGLDVKKAER